MTEEKEDRVYWNGDSENFCKVKQPLLFKVRYFLFYLFFSGNLDWKNSWFTKYINGYQTIYGGMGYRFTKVTNCRRYDTKIKHSADLLLTVNLETFKDLSDFCGKKFKTKEYCFLLKTPTKYKFLKYFYPELWTVKHKANILHFNVLNQLVKKEYVQGLQEDYRRRLLESSLKLSKKLEGKI